CVEFASEQRTVTTADVFDVIRLVGFEQQQLRRAVGLQSLLPEEVGITRRDDSFARQQTGVPMVGMQSVTLPRIVPEHDLWPQFANRRAARAPGCEGAA